MSANASKSKIISLDQYRSDQLKRAARAPAFDPDAIRQRITMGRISPTPESRDLARELVLQDAEEMLRVLGVMGAEIVAFRQQVKALVQQTADTSVINSLLLHLAGGVIRVNAKWFEEWEPPEGSGFMVNEEGDEVVIRAIVVDENTTGGASLMSADQQTEE